MIESNASLYLGEEMMMLHQEALETYFRDFIYEESASGEGGGGGGGSGSGGGSPRAKAGSDTGNLGADSRPRAPSSQVFISISQL